MSTAEEFIWFTGYLVFQLVCKTSTALIGLCPALAQFFCNQIQVFGFVNHLSHPVSTHYFWQQRLPTVSGILSSSMNAFIKQIRSSKTWSARTMVGDGIHLTMTDAASDTTSLWLRPPSHLTANFIYVHASHTNLCKKDWKKHIENKTYRLKRIIVTNWKQWATTLYVYLFKKIYISKQNFQKITYICML